MSRSKTGGLAGVVAGRTGICTVGKEGAGLGAAVGAGLSPGQQSDLWSWTG